VELIASSDAACLRLRQIPGIGPLVATAIVASIGNGAAFGKPDSMLEMIRRGNGLRDLACRQAVDLAI
jgi:transposase